MEPVEEAAVVRGGRKWSIEGTKTWAKDTLERSLSTLVQTFLTFIIASDGLDLSAKHAAFAAGLTAAMVVLKQTIVAQNAPAFGNKWADLLSRSGWTFLQTAVTLLAVEGFSWADMTAWQGVGIAGIAAALSVVKGFLADRVTNDTITPASFVKPAEELPMVA